MVDIERLRYRSTMNKIAIASLLVLAAFVWAAWSAIRKPSRGNILGTDCERCHSRPSLRIHYRLAIVHP
jgi:hypothetical protein